MSEQVPFVFFCSEIDYPKFRSILPNDLPATYKEFVAGVDKGINDAMEDITITKTYVGPDEFISYCAERGEIPSCDALVRCTFFAWGRATGGSTTS